MFQAKYTLPPCPVDDTQEPKDTSQSEDNKSRCKLASLFRLLDAKGWSTHLYNDIAFRCTQEPTQFYTCPFGLTFGEISASKIIKLDQNGNFVQHGNTDYGYSLPAFYVQSAIFHARPEVSCIIQLNEPLLTGVSSTKQGFLPLSVESLACSDISYADFSGPLDSSSVENYIKILGSKNRVLVLRNHGVIVCGSTIEETYFTLCALIMATKTQVIASAVGNDLQNLIVLPLNEMNLDREKLSHCYTKMNAKANDNILWKLGELEFEAEMRKLDCMGFRTGYPYKKKFQVESIH